MKQFYLILLLGVLITGCKDGAGKYGPNPFSKNDRVTEEPTEEVQSLTRSEIEAFMQRWIKVYNTHTYDTYVKLYDRELFRGVKRPVGGSKNTYDYDGWVENKRSEFRKYKPEVLMDELRITNLNENGVSKVSFQQTWISYSATYADRGEKVMTLRKVNGEIKIIYEELLYSEPADEYFYGT
ncbi:MAG: hypothetical protein ACKO6Q_00395 [Bacteroidota bacterium]